MASVGYGAGKAFFSVTYVVYKVLYAVTKVLIGIPAYILMMGYRILKVLAVPIGALLAHVFVANDLYESMPIIDALRIYFHSFKAGYYLRVTLGGALIGLLLCIALIFLGALVFEPLFSFLLMIPEYFNFTKRDYDDVLAHVKVSTGKQHEEDLRAIADYKNSINYHSLDEEII